MKKILFTLILIASIHVVSAAVPDIPTRIEMGVSPIRNELNIPAGSTQTGVIRFRNNAPTPYKIYISVEDCTPDSNYGTPKCKAQSQSGMESVSFSNWIVFPQGKEFTIPGKQEKLIPYTIKAPNNAVPGGHYGSVFFNNPDTSEGGNNVKMIRRIGVLFLVQIPGQLVFDTKVGNISTENNSGLTFSSAPPAPNNWLALLHELNPFWEEPKKEKENFEMTFTIPLTNSGNTHIKPQGNIILKDGDGNILQRIGKESLKNEDGAFIGEKIVDYLPINDEGGNVLPNTTRTFEIKWSGFAYEVIENGEKVIKFESPSDFYSKQLAGNKTFLFPWEKLKLTTETKNFTANMNFSYIGQDGKEVPYTLTKDISVQYQSIRAGMNWGVIMISGIGILMLWFLFRRGRNKEERISKQIPKGRPIKKKVLAKRISR